MDNCLFELEIVGSTLTCNNYGLVNKTCVVDSTETEFVCAIESGMDITPPTCDECGHRIIP